MLKLNFMLLFLVLIVVWVSTDVLFEVVVVSTEGTKGRSGSHVVLVLFTTSLRTKMQT